MDHIHRELQTGPDRNWFDAAAARKEPRNNPTVPVRGILLNRVELQAHPCLASQLLEIAASGPSASGSTALMATATGSRKPDLAENFSVENKYLLATADWAPIVRVPADLMSVGSAPIVQVSESEQEWVDAASVLAAKESLCSESMSLRPSLE